MQTKGITRRETVFGALAAAVAGALGKLGLGKPAEAVQVSGIEFDGGCCTITSGADLGYFVEYTPLVPLDGSIHTVEMPPHCDILNDPRMTHAYPVQHPVGHVTTAAGPRCPVELVPNDGATHWLVRLDDGSWWVDGERVGNGESA